MAISSDLVLDRPKASRLYRCRRRREEREGAIESFGVIV